CCLTYFHLHLFISSSIIPTPPTSTLFPYTTLFRSTPITFNDRFSDAINARKRVELGIRSTETTEPDHFIRSNYLDLAQLQDYWSPKRLNHHTEATTAIYALHTGLRLA